MPKLACDWFIVSKLFMFFFAYKCWVHTYILMSSCVEGIDPCGVFSLQLISLPHHLSIISAECLAKSPADADHVTFSTQVPFATYELDQTTF